MILVYYVDGLFKGRIMSDSRNEVTFRDGDQIKFQVLGFTPETAGHFLPRLRPKVYFGIRIIEKNGEALASPVELECGLHIDRLPAGMSITLQDGGLALDGLDPGKFWTAALKHGMPRARAENAGKWIAGETAAFINEATLSVTQEQAPPPIQFEESLIEETESAVARPKDSGWFAQIARRLGRPRVQT